jgi:hypothetical protein
MFSFSTLLYKIPLDCSENWPEQAVSRILYPLALARKEHVRNKHLRYEHVRAILFP